ncbi:unnamed protein product [Boreogadus saida]
MMDRCRCCVLAGCAIIVLAVAAVEPVSFKDTFIKDCETKAKSTHCEEVWSAFEQAHVNQDHCQVPPEAYDHLLLSVAPPQPNENRMLFWSEIKAVAHQVAKGCYQMLSDTLLGSVLDGKVWCGKKGSKETFTVGCPGWSFCVNNTVKSFWSRASAAFAAVAKGKVVVLLNGDSPTPFNPTSVFARIEVLGFKRDRVTSLTVVLVTKNEVGANCTNASLDNLQDQLKTGITYICKKMTESQLIECTDANRKTCEACW